jgi:uncharacterized membrane protein
MYEKEKERSFHYELEKVRTDFDFFLALFVSILAILFGLFSYYRDNPLFLWLVAMFIIIVMILLYLIYAEKEKALRKIKKKYIDSYWD